MSVKDSYYGKINNQGSQKVDALYSEKVKVKPIVKNGADSRKQVTGNRIK